jgi:signal transduction histidine kinase
MAAYPHPGETPPLFAEARSFWTGRLGRVSPRTIAVIGLALLAAMIGSWALAFQWLKHSQEQIHAEVVQSDTTIHELLTLTLKVEDPDFADQAYARAAQIEPFDETDLLADAETSRGLGVSFSLPVPAILEHVKKLVADDVIAKARARELGTFVYRKLGEPGGFEDPDNEARLRTIVLTMIRHEEGDLHARRKQTDSIDAMFISFSAAAAIGTYVCLLLTIILMSASFALAKRAQEQSLEKERRFRAVVENGADAFVLFRARRHENGRLKGFKPIYLNGNAERILAGIDIDAMTVDGLRQQITRETRRHQSDVEIYAAGDVVQSEIRLQSGPLQGRDYQEQIIPLPEGMAISYRDITERKQVERLRSEFIASISHELRTPLTAIRGSLSLINAGAIGTVPDGIRDMIRIADSNSARLMRLITDVLDIARLESGDGGFQPQKLDLRRLLQSAMEDCAETAAQERVRLTLEPGTGEVFVLADVDRMTQVLRNLISNAVKFSKPDDEVTCSCGLAGRDAVVAVRDHGPGIPQDFQDRIFGKFMQANSGDGRQTGGAGLGLAIAKSIVEGMGGSIGFRPAPGSGTVFFFSMPVSADAVGFDAGWAA